MLITSYNRAVLGTLVGGVDNSGEGGDHAVETGFACTGTDNVCQRSGLGLVPPSDSPGDVLG